MAVNNQQRTINSIISPFPGRPRWCDRPSIIHTLSLLPLALSPFQPLIKFLHASGALRFIRSKSDLLPSFLRSASRFDTLHFLSCTSPCFLKTWLYGRNLFRLSHAKLQLNHHHQQTNTQFFYRPDALPVAQPTVSKHWREKYHIPRISLPQAHLGVFKLCLRLLIAPGYLGGGLPCLSSALWCQYPLLYCMSIYYLSSVFTVVLVLP